MNLYSHGVDPKLNFENMPQIIKLYEKLTQMKVPPRQPYVGELVYAAFSGSHQDAIAKGMAYRANNNVPFWNVPYLAIDPQDVGKEYMAHVIRINSQSGKGGVSYLLESVYGYEIPLAMREELGYTVTCSFTISKQSAFNPVTTSKQTKFAICNSSASIVVRVQ